MFFVIINDTTKQFAYTPAHSTFGLDASAWAVYSIEFASGDWENPNDNMQDEVALCVSEDYTEVKLVDLVGTKWVTQLEFAAFLAKYKTEYAATQRFGQAFLNHFKDRFTDPWPELFYCEEEHKARSIIGALTF